MATIAQLQTPFNAHHKSSPDCFVDV